MNEPTNKHYDVFETKELARERIKAEEAERQRDRETYKLERENDRDLILNEIKLIKKDIEISSLKTRNWLMVSTGGILFSIVLAISKHFLGW